AISALPRQVVLVTFMLLVRVYRFPGKFQLFGGFGCHAQCFSFFVGQAPDRSAVGEFDPVGKAGDGLPVTVDGAELLVERLACGRCCSHRARYAARVCRSALASPCARWSTPL